MRNESERAYQEGGVAALIPDPDEEAQEAATPPDPRAELLSKIRMNKESALESLRAGRSELTAMRAKAEAEDKRARWLALAQGMLAPTKTGGFGESLGTTAGLLRQEQELSRKAEIERAEQMRAYAEEERDVELDALKAEAGLLSPEGSAKVVRATQAYHTDDTAAFNAGEINPATGDVWRSEDRRLVWLEPHLTAGGVTVNDFARDEDGNLIEVPSALDPRLAGQIASAKAVGAFAPEDLRDEAKGGMLAARQMPRLLDARDVFNKLADAGEITSGLRADVMGLAQYFGFAEQIKPSTDLSTLQGYLGNAILQELQLLTGPKSDFEYKKVSEMLPNLGKDIKANQTLLNKMIERYQIVIDEGEHSARRLAEEHPDLAGDYAAQYERYRGRAAERVAEEAALPRDAPEGAHEILIQRIQDLGPEATPEQRDAEIERFEQRWDVNDETKLLLRGPPYNMGI